MNAYRNVACFFVAMTIASSAVAQSYYDDDIYYNADKAKKEKAEKARQESQVSNQGYGKTYSQPLPGSDSYTVYTDNTRDVDEYNRRYLNTQAADTTQVSNIDSEEFSCTRQIERFYNDQIVSGSNDEELIEYYSNAQLAYEIPKIEISVIRTIDFWSPYYWTIVRPYSWYPSWGFSYYDPWTYWYYGCPAWDYSWHFAYGHWHNKFHYPRPDWTWAYRGPSYSPSYSHSGVSGQHRRSASRTIRTGSDSFQRNTGKNGTTYNRVDNGKNNQTVGNSSRANRSNRSSSVSIDRGSDNRTPNTGNSGSFSRSNRSSSFSSGNSGSRSSHSSGSGMRGGGSRR